MASRKTRFALIVAMIGAMAAAFPAMAQSSRQAADRQSMPVQTRDGPVRGFVRDGVTTFLGIPYAAPPVGDRRWKPPVPAPRHGLLDATKFASSCPQNNPLVVFTAGQSVDEDCLYLNIFTTGVGPSNGKLKPVIVWIHGGGSFTGSPADYDGSALAKGGPDGTPTVVVTINYRLGLLGFLAHPAFRKEGGHFANYGIMDQQAALRWVQANIRAFGGDPARVAVGGQSGGSVDTHAHVVSPLSAGLLNRAIFMSVPTGNFVPLDAAMRRGEAFAVAAGCQGSEAAAAGCLRKLSVPRLLQLQGTTKDNGPYLDPANQNVILDGSIIPLQLSEAYASGKFNRMPVLGGATKDELTFVIGMQQYYSGPPPGSAVTPFSGPPQRSLTAEDYAAKVAGSFGPAAARVLAQYPVAKYGGDPVMAYNRVLGDPIECFANLGALKLLARTVPTYGYDFTYREAPYYMPHMPGFRALAAHTIDIQFLFRGYHGGPLGVNLDQITGMPRELNAREGRLSEQLIGFWTTFADTGNPNKPGRTDWPQFTPNAPVFLQQDVPLSRVPEAQFRAQYQCAFWESLQAPAG